MKNFDRQLQNWSLYKDLELLPTSETRTASFPTFGLDRLWHGLLGLLSDELAEDQRVDYLERCLQQDASRASEKAHGMQSFLKLIE